MTLVLSNRSGSIATEPYSDRFGPKLPYYLPMTLGIGVSYNYFDNLGT